MIPDEVLALIGVMLVLAAAVGSAVGFLRHDDDPATIRRRQSAIAALFLAAAAAYMATGTQLGLASGGMWLIFASAAVQKIPTKKKVAKQRAKREAELAAQRAAELEQGNAQADEVAAQLGLKPMPRIHDA